MQSLTDLPTDLPDGPARVLVLEAAPGTGQRDSIQRSLQQIASSPATPWLLSCDRRAAGPWAGVAELFDQLVPQLQRGAPELVVHHDYELAAILPTLRGELAVRNLSLTDISAGAERTRSYPGDRVFRIVHGLVDLLAAWYARPDVGPCLIVCQHFDHASNLVQRFFTELVRRRGAQIELTLLVAVKPGAGATTAGLFSGAPVALLQPALPAEAAPVDLPEVWASQAEALIAAVGQDELARERYLPQIIRALLESEQPARAFAYQVEACEVYNMRGFYEDALAYGLAALTQLGPIDAHNRVTFLHLAKRLYNSYLGLSRGQEALDIVEQGLAHDHEGRFLAQWYDMLAILYVRFLPERDLDRAERYLEQGLAALERSPMPADRKIFQTVYNRNGLALIRHFQGRADEAITLCTWGCEQIDRHLQATEQQLYRSVLLYNIAQVHFASKRYDDAIIYYTRALAIDPHYSEYFNERGNAYLRLGRFEQAVRDYHAAIQLSPPYMEVWVNLAQCYQQLEQPADAAAAFARALDLAPEQHLALVGRAQALAELGQSEAACADYTAALQLRPDDPAVLVNRAVLHYAAGRIEQSLADLDRAIELEPATPDFYQNRAVALSDLGRFDQAARDLEQYLRLSPAAEDRAEVAEQLAALQLEHALV